MAKSPSQPDTSLHIPSIAFHPNSLASLALSSICIKDEDSHSHDFITAMTACLPLYIKRGTCPVISLSLAINSSSSFYTLPLLFSLSQASISSIIPTVCIYTHHHIRFILLITAFANIIPSVLSYVLSRIYRLCPYICHMRSRLILVSVCLYVRDGSVSPSGPAQREILPHSDRDSLCI